MRAGPSEEQRGTLHYIVPVYPQCPQEISLLTLPVVGPQQATVMEQEVSSLLRNEAIEVVPPVLLDKESRFYSRTSLFLGSMGVATYFNLSQLNRLVMLLKIRMLSSSRSCHRPDPRTVVTSDLEDTYFPSPSFPITGSS